MIDFRYHLVSLVSVFMALAIGVVLGAGPLKESIGDQLSNQVEGLLADKTALQQAVANRDQKIADRDAFIEGVSPSIISEQLGGRSVVLLTMPGASVDDADALAEELTSAGATLTGRVDINERWIDPEQSEFRKTLAGSQIQYVEPRPPAATGGEGELAAVLARAVLTKDVAEAGQADTDAQTILGALGGGELVGVQGEPWNRAQLAVVLASAPEDAAGAGDADWVEAAGTSVVTLLRALDTTGNGTVLAGPTSAADGDGLLGRVRSDDLATSVSTVDTVDSPMGRATVVMALREQAGGGAGQYGFGEGASAPIPATAGAPAPAPTEG